MKFELDDRTRNMTDVSGPREMNTAIVITMMVVGYLLVGLQAARIVYVSNVDHPQHWLGTAYGSSKYYLEYSTYNSHDLSKRQGDMADGRCWAMVALTFWLPWSVAWIVYRLGRSVYRAFVRVVFAPTPLQCRESSERVWKDILAKAADYDLKVIP